MLEIIFTVVVNIPAEIFGSLDIAVYVSVV